MANSGLSIAYSKTAVWFLIASISLLKSLNTGIGNLPIKIDLRIEGEPSHISPELGVKMADQFSELLSDGKLKVNYIETSAKTGENVEAAFSALVETIVYVNS